MNCVHSAKIRVIAVGVVLSALAMSLADAHASQIDLGNAAQYTVFGLSNTMVNLSNTSVDGNVGVGPNGDLKLAAPSVVNGNAYLDFSATETADTGTLTGSLIRQSMAAPVQTVLALSAYSSGLTPTLTLNASQVNNGYTFNGNGGINVIDINGNVNLNNYNLKFNGAANDLFYVNFNGSLTLNGSASIGESGSTGPLSVLLNVTGGNISAHVGDEVNGILLAPTENADLDGTYNGYVISGGVLLGLHAGATVNQVGQVAVPEPSTLALIGVAGLTLLSLRRRQH